MSGSSGRGSHLVGEGADHSYRGRLSACNGFTGCLRAVETTRQEYLALLLRGAAGKGGAWVGATVLSVEFGNRTGVSRRGFAAAPLRHPPRPDLPLTLECREELVGFYAHHGFLPGRPYRLPRTATMVSVTTLLSSARMERAVSYHPAGWVEVVR